MQILRESMLEDGLKVTLTLILRIIIENGVEVKMRCLALVGAGGNEG